MEKAMLITLSITCCMLDFLYRFFPFNFLLRESFRLKLEFVTNFLKVPFSVELVKHWQDVAAFRATV